MEMEAAAASPVAIELNPQTGSELDRREGLPPFCPRHMESAAKAPSTSAASAPLKTQAKKTAKNNQQKVSAVGKDKPTILTSLKKAVEEGQKHRDKLIYPIEVQVSQKMNAQNHESAAPKEKEDDMLAQFDQYVIYKDMEKKKQQALEMDYARTAKAKHGVPCVKNKSEKKGAENEQNENLLQDIVPISTDSSINERNTEVQHVEGPETTIMIAATSLSKRLVQIEEEKYIQEESYNSDCSTDQEIEQEDGEGDGDMHDVDGGADAFFPTGEELSEERKPEIGMHFDTLEAAHRFLNVHGYLHGYSVIKGRNYRHKKITFQCSKCRKTHDPGNLQRKRKRSVNERTGCPMNVIVKLQNGHWEIIGTSLDHNHDLLNTPSLTKFFSNHRHMSEEDKNLSMILQDCRVAPRRIMSIFRRLKGSRKVLSFNKKKIQNQRRGERREKNTDIGRALKFVEKLQVKKQGVVMKMDTDDDNTVRSIIWTDARSMMDYRLYGDFLSFDTTFSTNKYNMPFAPFIGINGQGRTIVFAWALLKDQTADSFSWAFETFLDLMNGKRPEIIMTDQDAAIKSAIDDVLSSVWHRFCFWHVMNNCSEKIGGFVAAREGMEEDMNHAIMDSLTVEEFESNWQAMIVKYDAASNKHLTLMWKWRKQWVPVYFKSVFCPFIRTTGRSEGMNSVFKDYVKRKDTIETFLIQYDLFQENIVETENEDRFESLQQDPIYLGFNRIERHAGKIYTRGIFFKFQHEMHNSTAFAVEVVEEEKIYNLRKMFNYPKQEYHREVFQVNVDRSEGKYDCICAKYQRDGILCCHVLRLFTQFDIIHIPERYINKRWTKAYREEELLKHRQETIAEVPGSGNSEISIRYAVLMSKVTDVCTEVSRDADSSKEFLEELQKLQEKYSSKHKLGPVHGQPSNGEPLKDPPINNNKSVDKGNRLKRPSEKNSKKKNAKKKNGKEKDPVLNI